MDKLFSEVLGKQIKKMDNFFSEVLGGCELHVSESYAIDKIDKMKYFVSECKD